MLYGRLEVMGHRPRQAGTMTTKDTFRPSRKARK